MDEKTAIVESWKQSLAAKQHFDDITLKIRGLLLTLLTGMFGASELIKHDGAGTKLHVAMYLILGAFYLMDRWWYHFLLLGAVLHASSLEARAAALGLRLPGVKFKDPGGVERSDDNRQSQNSILGLTYRISTLHQSSMFGLKAKYKLDFYYLLIGIGLTVFVRS